jgi:hypothetical protein
MTEQEWQQAKRELADYGIFYDDEDDIMRELRVTRARIMKQFNNDSNAYHDYLARQRIENPWPPAAGDVEAWIRRSNEAADRAAERLKTQRMAEHARV